MFGRSPRYRIVRQIVKSLLMLLFGLLALEMCTTMWFYSVKTGVTNFRFDISGFGKVGWLSTKTLPCHGRGCQRLVKAARAVKFLIEPWNVKRRDCSLITCAPNYEGLSKNITWGGVIFVKSMANSFYRRQLLRRTWATVYQVGNGNISIVFIVGNPANSSRLQNWLYDEGKSYGDLLQFQGPDDYKNIAYKTLAGMEWASTHLPEEFVYSSMDDDFMVDIFKYNQAVLHGFEYVSNRTWPEYPIICMFHASENNEKPVREKDGEYQKWYINETLFKWPVFPRYCHGGMYSTSVRIVQQLLEESYTVEPLYLDDVWITGILRQKIGMPDSMVVTFQEKIGMHRNKDMDKTDEFINDWDTLTKDHSTTLCSCSLNV